MKCSKVLPVVDTIILVAMVVIAILYFANVWHGGYEIFMLLMGVSRITWSVNLWNEKRRQAIASLSMGVLMICLYSVSLLIK